MEKIIDEIEKIKRVEYARGYQDGLLAQKYFEEQFEKVAKAAAEETAQEVRDRIVAQAKADIEGLKTARCEFGVKHYPVGDKMFRSLCYAQFIVNKEKRTVVALLRSSFYDDVRAKGIAKCAPTDCFNEHIGKAISVRRALGLDIPEEYMNAPNPTEVRRGNVAEVVLSNGESDISTVESVNKHAEYNVEMFGRLVEFPSNYVKIIDDSVSDKEESEC